MVSMPLVQGKSTVQLRGSGMLANEISDLLRSPSSSGNLLQQNATIGDRLCRVVQRRQKKEETNRGRRETAIQKLLVTANAVQNTYFTCGTAPLFQY